MKLKELVRNIDCEIYGNENVEIENLTHNSKEKNENGVFFAINGGKFNGEEFAFDSIKNGAKVVVSENKIKDLTATNVVVKDVRKAMSLMARDYYKNPAEKMFVIGVTGTNGKTTSTYMLKSIFEEAGRKVGVIGTNGVVIKGKKIKSDFTTPDPIILQKVLAEMRDEKVDVVCMETSAHALELQKLWGVMTDIALFTNLSQDHLDYFDNMQNYFSAKSKFFSPEYSRFGVVNIDDEYGKIINDSSKIPLITYSKTGNQEADILANNLKHNYYDQEFDVKTMKGDMHIKLNMLGSFNVSNALGVIAAAIMAGVETKYIKAAFEKLEHIDGRFNSYWVKGVRVIVDYAHTPDGLENILNSAREFTEKRLISVFGCGGDRDKTKRPIMGEISTRLADLTIITTDNPRNEKVIDIMEEIERGTINDKYLMETDRISAIKKALDMATYGDTVVISGKGTENYIDIGKEKLPYITDAGIIKEMQAETFKKIEQEALLL